VVDVLSTSHQRQCHPAASRRVGMIWWVVPCSTGVHSRTTINRKTNRHEPWVRGQVSAGLELKLPHLLTVFQDARAECASIDQPGAEPARPRGSHSSPSGPTTRTADRPDQQLGPEALDEHDGSDPTQRRALAWGFVGMGHLTPAEHPATICPIQGRCQAAAQGS
jgi:hypothetical protein